MIAPYYADLDLTNGGHIDYYVDPAGHYLVVAWTDVAYFGGGQLRASQYLSDSDHR